MPRPQRPLLLVWLRLRRSTTYRLCPLFSLGWATSRQCDCRDRPNIFRVSYLGAWWKEVLVVMPHDRFRESVVPHIYKGVHFG